MPIRLRNVRFRLLAACGSRRRRRRRRFRRILVLRLSLRGRRCRVVVIRIASLCRQLEALRGELGYLEVHSAGQHANAVRRQTHCLSACGRIHASARKEALPHGQ